MFKLPDDDRTFAWTRHSKNKLMFYGLSAARIKSIVRNPKRREEGIAPDTIGVMRPTPLKKKPEEIWVLYKINASRHSREGGNLNGKIPDQVRNDRLRARFTIISAWRYPGVTKPGTPIPVPPDILEELQ